MTGQPHGEGIWLFAGGTTGAPDPNLLLAVLLGCFRSPTREDMPGQVLKVLCLAKELGLVGGDGVDHLHPLPVLVGRGDEFVILGERTELQGTEPSGFAHQLILLPPRGMTSS